MRDEDLQLMFSTPNKLKLGEQRVLEARLRALRKVKAYIYIYIYSLWFKRLILNL
jgi:hypothetical protein